MKNMLGKASYHLRLTRRYTCKNANDGMSIWPTFPQDHMNNFCNYTGAINRSHWLLYKRIRLTVQRSRSSPERRGMGRKSLPGGFLQRSADIQHRHSELVIYTQSTPPRTCPHAPTHNRNLFSRNTRLRATHVSFVLASQFGTKQ